MKYVADVGIFKKMIDKWGAPYQILMAVEEMSELQKEVLKNCNRRKENVAAIAEEIADVLITVEQLIHIYGVADDVERHIAAKLERVKPKLEE